MSLMDHTLQYLLVLSNNNLETLGHVLFELKSEAMFGLWSLVFIMTGGIY